MDINELVSNELLPLDENPFQLINLLKEAGIEYNSSTKEFKITGDDHTLVLPLRKENLIKLEFGDLFYDMLKKEINSGYKFGLYSGVAVLSRKLIENLLIDILRKKYPRSQKGNLELYYDKNRRRFHDFAILIENLEKRKREFEIDEPTVSINFSFALEIATLRS